MKDPYLRDLLRETNVPPTPGAHPATVEQRDAQHGHRLHEEEEHVVEHLEHVEPEAPVPDFQPEEPTLLSLWSLSSHPKWPSPLGEAAYHGVTGDFVRLVSPHTEADLQAVLVQFLVTVGNMIGRNLHFTAGGRRHYTNLNTGIVGKTAKSRKGTSYAPSVTVIGAVDEYWESERRQSGLSSGEGLISAVRDPLVKVEGGEQTTVDPGVEDKRLLVVEEDSPVFSR